MHFYLKPNFDIYVQFPVKGIGDF